MIDAQLIGGDAVVQQEVGRVLPLAMDTAKGVTDARGELLALTRWDLGPAGGDGVPEDSESVSANSWRRCTKNKGTIQRCRVSRTCHFKMQA